jgi:hypothetical protein
MTSFETKKKIVLAGNSRIFNDWAAHSTITMDEFISALQWLCEDELDKNGKITREIALAPDRIVKLRRVNDGLGMTAFYKYPRDNGGDGELGSLWSGEKFPDGFVRKISLSVKDRI